MSSRTKRTADADATPAMRPLRETQKAMTRERVIAAAIRVFDERGFLAATMDDIAHEALMNRGTIYLHFSNKTEILRATVAQMPPPLPLLIAALESEDRASRRAAFAALYEHWERHLAPVWWHVRAAAGIDEEMNSWLNWFALNEVKRTQACLERFGVPRRDAHPRAFMLHCLWNEYVYHFDDAQRAFKADAAIDALTDLFEGAARPPSR